MNRSKLLAAMATSFLLGSGAACGPDVDRAPDSVERVVKISGNLIRDDDRPAAGAKVTLLRDGAQLAATEADAEGSYLFLVEQEGTQGDHVLGVRGEITVDGAAAEVGVDFAAGAAENVSLPALRFLEAPLSYSDSGDQVTVTIPNFAGADGRRPLGYELQVFKLSGWLLASQPASASSSVVRVHKALLEDFITKLRLAAELDLGSNLSGFAAAPQVQLGAQNAAPLSRGAGCAYSNTAAQTPAALSPCPVTDGNLQTFLDPSAAICDDPNPDDAIDVCASTWERLVVDLGAVQGVQIFALHDRGSAAAVLLEYSEDGIAYTSIGSISVDSFIFDTPFAARYLRLSYLGQALESQLAGLNEIVVY